MIVVSNEKQQKRLLTSLNKMRIKRKDKLPRRIAHELVMTTVKYGNHYYDFKFEADADVKRVFKINGIEFQELVEECRNYNSVIPFFENAIGSTFISLNDARMSIVNLDTGQEDAVIDGPGEIAVSKYLSDYEKAHRHLNNSIDKSSFDELQSAILWGITAIESYINHRIKIWNDLNPHDKLVDSKVNKISIDKKIDEWIPRISNGKYFIKGDKCWSDYIALRNFRDTEIIHAKTSGSGMSYAKMVENINIFKTGVAGILIKLHQIFEEKIPAKIIRGYYAPEVEVIHDE